MAGLTEVFNGVTKQEVAGVYVYTFPIAKLVADDSDDSIEYNIYTIGAPVIFKLFFADITDKKGATTATEYVEALALEGAFSNATGSSGGVIVDDATAIVLGSGVLQNDYEIRALDLLNQINEQLKHNNFLLKGISE